MTGEVVGDDKKGQCRCLVPAGVAAARSRKILFGGEDCLSEALVLSVAKELRQGTICPSKRSVIE